MTSKPRQCDSDQIDRLLDGRLTAEAESDLIEHVDLCTPCREQLERRAAEPDCWQAASDFLRDDALDSASLSHGSSGDCPALSDRVRLEDDTSRRIIEYLDPTDDPCMLGRFGGYEIVGVIGSGGMGVVLKGFEGPLNRFVAIKVLAPHLAASGAARQRFAREAQAAAAVIHDNVVAIHRVADSGGLPYLVMPYLPGTTLQKRLDENGPLSVAEVLRIGMQVAAGLAAAHAQGLVHRDIKPSNILLESGVDRVRITDFGLARAADDASLTRSGVIAGTPQFMSPEQARGESVDPRSDLFSLGSVMYHMCTGRPPFRAETSYGVLRRITDSQPRAVRELNPNTPDWLATLIDRLLAKEPAARFQSARKVAALLEQSLAHVQQPNAVPIPEELRHTDRIKTRRVRVAARRVVLIASIIVSAIIPAAVFWMNYSNVNAPDQSRSESSASHAISDEITDTAIGWNDGSSDVIDQLKQDATRLESDAERIWELR